MNTNFNVETIELAAGGARKALPNPCEFFVVRAKTGACDFRVTGGGWCPLKTSDNFRTVNGQHYVGLEFRSLAGGSLTILYGFGQLVGGGGSGTGQLLTGDGAPVTPPDDTAEIAFYWDRIASAMYAWNTTTQAWV